MKTRILFLVLCVFACAIAPGWAQSNKVSAVVTSLPSIPAGTNVIGHVICDAGCSGSGGTSSSFGSSFPSVGTAIGFHNGSGNMDYASVDASHRVSITLDANTVSPNSGQASSAADTIMCATDIFCKTAAQATNTGGTTGCTIVSAASTNAQNCASAAAGWYGARILNTTTTTYYLRRYNLASTPTCSSSTGFVDSIPIPPAGSSGQVGGFVEILPIAETATFTTGLGWCITGGSSSTDNTNAATGIFGTVYKK